LPTCSEKLPAERAEKPLLATADVEYHEEVVASVLTFTTWVPLAAAPVADAVAMLESEVPTPMDDKDPV
jgi:hypothetical protein